MIAEWGTTKGKFQRNMAYMKFKDGDVNYILAKYIDKGFNYLETFIYHPNNKKYEMVCFKSKCSTENTVSKPTMRKTWKSLAEQEWKEYDSEEFEI